MRRSKILIFCGLLAVSLALAGVFVYDATRADRIAPGVTIDGIAVGGLDVAEARMKLHHTVLEPLQDPLVVRHGERRFKLTARRARLDVDVNGSARMALAASRQGNAFTRTWREVTGAELRRDIDAPITYSRAAVSKLVERVSTELHRPAVDAKVRIRASGVHVSRARTGREVDSRRLERQLHRRLVAYDGRRTVKVSTSKVKPQVSDRQLRRRHPAVLIIDRSAFTLTLYKGLKRSKRYTVAVGAAGMETPEGLYNIQNKAINPAWHVPDSEWAGDLRGKVIPGDDPSNPLKARWLGIYDGAGIHGTDARDSIGTAASHGCIRMRIPDVIELYDQVPVGSSVFIS